MSNENEALQMEIEPDTEADEFKAPAVVETLQNKLQLAGITPDTLSKYLYTFEAQGKEVADVSADGINHIAQSAGVSTESVEILEETDESIMVQAVAVNQDGIKHIGMVRESKLNKSGYPNPYALQNAVSKAQRNAKKGLLPMTFVRDLIKQATGGMPTVDELEGRLENAKDTYRDQRDEIQELKGQITQFREQITQLEAENTLLRESSESDGD